MADVNKFFTKPQLAHRYGVSTRSVDRWVEAKRFPPADVRLPNGWLAWADKTIEKHERNSVATATVAA